MEISPYFFKIVTISVLFSLNFYWLYNHSKWSHWLPYGISRCKYTLFSTMRTMCKGIYTISLRPVDQLQRQPVVRVYSMCHTVRLGVGVLAKVYIQIGHKYSDFEIFSLHSIRNSILRSKCLSNAKTLFKMHFMIHSSKGNYWHKFKNHAAKTFYFRATAHLTYTTRAWTV